MNEPEVLPPWKAVAMDVIARLDFLTLTTGNYIRWIGGDIPPDVVDDGKDLQSVVDVVERNCQVCLLGAAILSKARVMDAVPANKVITRYGGITLRTEKAADLLTGVFERSDCALMESAYEMNARFAREYFGPDGGQIDKGLVYGAAVFGAKVGPVREDRVRAVMENVLANGGRFVPPTATLEEWYATTVEDEKDGE